MKTNFLMIRPEDLASLDAGAAVRSSPSGVEVRGSLGSYFYRWLAEDFGAALALVPAGSKLLITMDTPGGYVTGCFEACHDLQNIRAQYPDVTVAVFTDSMLASAGYALACAMTGADKDEIVCTPQALVGSIGVIASRFEEDLEKTFGFKIHYFATGAAKIEGRPGTALSKEEASKIQADVDLLGERFFAVVEASRDLSVKEVKALDAEIFRGDAALAAGLVDAVYPSRAAYLTDPVEPKTEQQEDSNDMAMTPEEQAEMATLRADLAASNKRSEDMAAAQKAADERARKALIDSRADLPEKTRALMASMSLEQVQELTASLPVPEPKKVAGPESEEDADDDDASDEDDEEATAAAAAKRKNKPTKTVPPINPVADLSSKLPQADESKLDQTTLNALDRNLKHRQLSEKQLARCEYDPISGVLQVR